MEDLMFLSAYDPECFEKTCRNLVYNVPEAKKLMEPDVSAQKDETVIHDDEKELQGEKQEKTFMCQPMEEDEAHKKSKEIENLLANLKNMEWKGQVMQDVPVDKVKNLLGSLYMEMMFPHNDRTRSFPLDNTVESTLFNKKA